MNSWGWKVHCEELMEGSSDPLEASPVKLLLCENHQQVTFEVSTYLYGLVQRVCNVFPQTVIC